MKITTEICKNAIVDYIKKNPQAVSHAFDPPLQDISEALNVKNWKRELKEKIEDLHWCYSGAPHVPGIERMFDCRPYEDQIRAYVLTNKENTEILHIIVCGE